MKKVQQIPVAYAVRAETYFAEDIALHELRINVISEPDIKIRVTHLHAEGS